MVLRLHARAATLGAKERALADLVAGQIPIAPVLGCGESSSGHAFTLLSFVDGDTLEQVLLAGNPARIAHAARALGRTLAQLANHHFDEPGDLVATPGAEEGELAAVLDWEFSHAGSIWMDLGNLLRHRPETPLPDSFAPLVLEGLQDAGVTLPAHWRTLSAITDLSSACELPQLRRRPPPDSRARLAANSRHIGQARPLAEP